MTETNTAAPAATGCDRLLDLLAHLCSAEDDPAATADWVLDWLAYPLQNPGAKMYDALVVAGPSGTGKSAFFDAVGSLYGGAHRSIGAHEVESEFNGWALGARFVVVEVESTPVPVVRLKNVIQRNQTTINRKFQAPVVEINRANVVVLCRHIGRAGLGACWNGMRIIQAPPRLDNAFYRAVHAEIATGGIQALGEFLMRRPLGDFRPFTAPPGTRTPAAAAGDAA
jgi:putative DNA primase/helicase